MYLEQAKQKEDKERDNHPEKYKAPKEPTSMYKPNGEIRMCNEGKYQFKMREFDDAETTTFSMAIPKHLDTSFVDVFVDPSFISVRVRGKLTQIKLYE